MAETDYELVVIGGGIHGAGVAQAAAAAGYSTLILEQTAWAAGTSSRSSKLLHGGLRYLESAQFALVRESLRERNRLLRLAPTLAHPLRFRLPVYRTTRRRPWQLLFGLSLYALLSGLTSPLSRFACSRSPRAGLKPEGLQWLFGYWDAQTDDVLLTRAVIQSAGELGARLLCPARLTGAQRETDGYSLQLVDSTECGDLPRTLRARFLVNCAGPWVNRVLAGISPATVQRPCELVKGSHLVLRERLSEEAFYLEAPADGRGVFLLPWGEGSLLGTTELSYDGDPRSVAVTRAERDYLLATARHYFPRSSFTPVDDFAGLRVLPAGDSASFSRRRDCILHRDPAHPRLLTLYGGKLTTYRHTAEQVIARVRRELGRRPPRADTRTLRLHPPTLNDRAPAAAPASSSDSAAASARPAAPESAHRRT